MNIGMPVAMTTASPPAAHGNSWRASRSLGVRTPAPRTVRFSVNGAEPGIPVLMKYGLGRSLIDAAFGVTIERRYAHPQGTAILAERWLAAVERTIVALAQDADMPASRGQPDIGDLAIAVGLAYIDFRLQAVRWRESAPALAGWLDAIGERPSLRVTRPE